MEFERCLNPICRKPIEPMPNDGSKWRRTPRKYCNDRCKRDGWILNRAAVLLAKLLPSEWIGILAAAREKQKGDNLREI